MTKHLFRHFKDNIIAYFALFVALGGTSYAARSLPQAPHQVHATKVSVATNAAAKVLWAYVSMGTPQSLAPGPNVSQTAVAGTPASVYHVSIGSWIVRFGTNIDLSNCARLANLTTVRGSATVGGYSSANPDPTAVPVLTTDAAGNPVDAAFVVTVICGGGKNLQTTPVP